MQLKIKETLHIKWRKPGLKAKQNHLAFILSLELASPLCSSLLFVFAFLFHPLFSLPLALIINIFYCLNNTLLLLHLIITYLVNTFNNNYVINICPKQLL